MILVLSARTPLRPLADHLMRSTRTDAGMDRVRMAAAPTGFHCQPHMPPVARQSLYPSAMTMRLSHLLLSPPVLLSDPQAWPVASRGMSFQPTYRDEIGLCLRLHLIPFRERFEFTIDLTSNLTRLADAHLKPSYRLIFLRRWFLH